MRSCWEEQHTEDWGSPPAEIITETTSPHQQHTINSNSHLKKLEPNIKISHSAKPSYRWVSTGFLTFTPNNNHFLHGDLIKFCICWFSSPCVGQIFVNISETNHSTWFMQWWESMQDLNISLKILFSHNYFSHFTSEQHYEYLHGETLWNRAPSPLFERLSCLC